MITLFSHTLLFISHQLSTIYFINHQQPSTINHHHSSLLTWTISWDFEPTFKSPTHSCKCEPNITASWVTTSPKWSCSLFTDKKRKSLHLSSSFYWKSLPKKNKNSHFSKLSTKFHRSWISSYNSSIHHIIIILSLPYYIYKFLHNTLISY